MEGVSENMFVDDITQDYEEPLPLGGDGSSSTVNSESSKTGPSRS